MRIWDVRARRCLDRAEAASDTMRGLSELLLAGRRPGAVAAMLRGRCDELDDAVAELRALCAPDTGAQR